MMKSFLLAAALAVAVAPAAMAQAAKPAAAPAAAPGQRTPEVKMVGDWAVRCFPVESPSPCDMYQELDNKDSRQRILSFSIAYVPSMDRNGIQISVPLEVALQKGLVIQTDSFTSPALHYRRCDRNGCYVEMPMDSSSIASLAKSGPDAKIRIVADGSNKAFDIKISLNGFSAAHDQMIQQAKEKARTPKPAADAGGQPAPQQ